jgi:HEAT repeat protein
VKTFPRRPNLDHLRRQGKDLLTELRHGSSEPDAIRLHHAQRLLAQRYGFRSWPALKAHVDQVVNAESYVRRWMRTYGVGVEPPAVGVMCDGAVKHPNPWVRWNCAGLLGNVADMSAMPALAAALRDPIPKVRRHALLALLKCERRLDVDIVPLLVERARRDDNDGVRLRVVRALLEHRPDPRVAEALHRVAKSDRHPSIRDVAAGDAPRGRYRVVLRRGRADIAG